MFMVGTKTLKIKEKDRRSIQTTNARMKDASYPRNGELKFSPLKLHIAIARCRLSKDLSNTDLLFEVLPNYLHYQKIINTSQSDLTLNEESFETLRDFSRKTRIGELAQGITYLLAQEHLKLPIVVDFEGFVKSKKPTASFRGEIPDFITQLEPTYNCIIIESKGHYVRFDKSTYKSINTSTKGKLSKALNQCANGRTIIHREISPYNVIKSFGVCARLHNEQDPAISEIHFVDPSHDESNDNFNIEIIQYHYASWFLLMGNIDIYNKLIKQEYIDTVNLRTHKKKEINGVIYYMFDAAKSKFFFKKNFGERLEESTYKFWDYGIREDVLKVLMGESNEFDKIDLQDSLENEGKKYVIFNDGTLIIAE